MTLADRIKRQAHELGFDLAGIAPAGAAQSHDRYVKWLAHGYHGEMSYLARPDAVARRAHVREVLPEARSVLVVGMNYFQPYPSTFPRAMGEARGVGVVARYAWGDDYHAIMADKLRQLAAFVESEFGQPVAHKVCVDTSAVLEREWAVRAGLGWIGKNTLLIHPRAGSWFLLGELLLGLDVEADAPFTGDQCGTCTRCLDACPTRCILPQRTLDARRCIAYLTIELRGDIPPAWRASIGNRMWGCDVCQEVCPWNRFARPTGEPALAPRQAVLDVRELANMDEAAWRARFARSPLRRAKRQGLARNAALVAANQDFRVALDKDLQSG